MAGDREGPIYLGWPHASYGAAWLIQMGVLSALYEREKTGHGQVVTTSLLDGIDPVASDFPGRTEPAAPARPRSLATNPGSGSGLD